VSVPVIFLDYLSYHAHRGRESFDTHVWMVKTFLGRSSKSWENKDDFKYFVLAASVGKMNMRFRKPLSKQYYNCLLKLKTTVFAYKKLPEGDSDRNLDKFIEAIPHINTNQITTTKFPNLLLYVTNLATNPSPPIGIYNESTYMEFHLLLCDLLSNFRTSLQTLQTLKQESNYNLEIIKNKVGIVQMFGFYLWTMVRSSAVETHLRTIADFLEVDTRKSWTSVYEEDDVEDADEGEFQALKTNSLYKGKPLSPWESYRNWLRLMVHYIEASRVLTMHVKNWNFGDDPITISTLSPPLPDNRLLKWMELLQDEHLFPTSFMDTPGNKFVEVLLRDIKTKIYDSSNYAEIKRSLELLRQPNLDDNFDTLVKQVNKCKSADGLHKIISEKVLALKNFDLQDRPAEVERILENLNVLLRRTNFYVGLGGKLCHGYGFTGKYHCEAYIASLLAFSGPSGQRIRDSEEQSFRPKIDKIEPLLEQMKASNVFMHRLNFADFNDRIAGIPSECLNDAARCVPSYSIC
jgi:hypothetical protein